MAHITDYALGGVRPGMVRLGSAWQGKVAGRNPCFMLKWDYYDKLYSRHCLARQGGAGLGRAMQGKGTGLQNPVHYA